jgi:hypothetical protein
MSSYVSEANTSAVLMSMIGSLTEGMLCLLATLAGRWRMGEPDPFDTTRVNSGRPIDEAEEWARERFESDAGRLKAVVSMLCVL